MTNPSAIAWCKREGIRVKNDLILNIIPEKCKNPAVNSTRSFRDLTEAEADLVENKGRMPARLRRKKRKSYAEVDLADRKNPATMPTGVRSKKNKTRAELPLFALSAARYGQISLHASRKRANTSAAGLAYPTQCQQALLHRSKVP